MTVDQRLAGLTVTVAGSGIGGLATAVALRRHGAAVTVLERAPRPEADGAGLSVWPNAVHALRALGVASDLEAAGVPRGAGGLWRWDGSPLASQDAHELEERYGAPMLMVHRAELLAALLGALPANTVVAGDALLSFSEDADGVTARFASGRTVRSDLLVGADGLRSVVRRGLLGDEEPRASGLVAYRGVVRHPLGDRVGEFWGPGGVVGLAPLSGGRAYWYATARASTGDRGPVSHAEHVRLVARLAGWAEPIRSVVASTPAERRAAPPVGGPQAAARLEQRACHARRRRSAPDAAVPRAGRLPGAGGRGVAAGGAAGRGRSRRRPAGVRASPSRPDRPAREAGPVGGQGRSPHPSLAARSPRRPRAPRVGPDAPAPARCRARV